MSITDEVVKREIASFNLKGADLRNDSTSTWVILKEIPLRYCSKNYLSFTPGKSTYISIYASYFDSSNHTISYTNHQEPKVLIDNKRAWGVGVTIPKTKLDSLFVVTHSHLRVKMPASSFIGLYEPHMCTVESKRSKRNKLESPYNKVFQSEDKRRMYIYMLNGEGTNRYEVTWIFRDGAYYTRVVDSVP